MRNVVGNPARGENFFRRDKEVKKILQSIENENNIQIAAPRRVGKTSILFHLADARVNGYKYVYIDTEGVDSEEVFYKKLLKEIVKLPGIEPLAEKFLKAAGSLARKIKSLKVMEVGIDWQEGPGDVSYYEDLVHLLSGIQLDVGMRLVLLIDEFPQTILNILKGDGVDKAIAFLQSNRTLRLHPDINPKVRFIYTGSIGLNHTVAAIDSTAFINDLNTIEVEALRPMEARSLLDELLKAKGISMQASAQAHLLKRLDWLIPFHVQLLVQELSRLDAVEGATNSSHVDMAFEAIISTRNDNHFAHYYSRLRAQFQGQQLKYALEILRIMAVSGAISRVQCLDLAVVYEIDDQWKRILEVLAYDGYINNNGDKDRYRFNSPVVKMWWLKYVC